MLEVVDSGGATGGTGGDSSPPILKSRQKLSMKNGIKLVGCTFRLKNYFKIPPISLRFFRAGAGTGGGYAIQRQGVMLDVVDTPEADSKISSAAGFLHKLYTQNAAGGAFTESWPRCSWKQTKWCGEDIPHPLQTCTTN